MKPMTITIKPSRIGGRAVLWYAEIDTPDHTTQGRETFFHRSSRRQVERLIQRLQQAEVVVAP